MSLDNATAVVTFDGSGTNLESADASTDIAVADGTGQDAPGGDGSSAIQILGSVSSSGLSDLLSVGVAIAALVAVAVVVLRRRSDETDPDSTETTGDAAADATGSDSSGPSGPAETEVSMSALQTATEALSEGYPNDAVVTAYAGVRDALGQRVDVETSATHWEFYRQCLDQGVDQEESLESLTMSYEKAAYSGLTMSNGDAEAVLETARLLLDGFDPQ